MDIPAVPALEFSPETEATLASLSISSEAFHKESNHLIPRPRSLLVESPGKEARLWGGGTSNAGVQTPLAGCY